MHHQICLCMLKSSGQFNIENVCFHVDGSCCPKTQIPGDSCRAKHIDRVTRDHVNITAVFMLV